LQVKLLQQQTPQARTPRETLIQRFLKASEVSGHANGGGTNLESVASAVAIAIAAQRVNLPRGHPRSQRFFNTPSQMHSKSHWLNSFT